MLELFELMKQRRSIRKYQDKQISKSDLEKIIEAGTYAPNAGGGQRSMPDAFCCAENMVLMAAELGISLNPAGTLSALRKLLRGVSRKSSRKEGMI